MSRIDVHELKLHTIHVLTEIHTQASNVGGSLMNILPPGIPPAAVKYLTGIAEELEKALAKVRVKSIEPAKPQRGL